MGAAEDFRSRAEGAAIPPIGPVAHGWIASDLDPQGIVCDAHLATAEKGRATAERCVAEMVGLLRRIEAEPVERYAPIRPAF